MPVHIAHSWLYIFCMLFILSAIYCRTLAHVDTVFCWLYPNLNKFYIILSYLNTHVFSQNVLHTQAKYQKDLIKTEGACSFWKKKLTDRQRLWMAWNWISSTDYVSNGAKKHQIILYNKLTYKTDQIIIINKFRTISLLKPSHLHGLALITKLYFTRFQKELHFFNKNH